MFMGSIDLIEATYNWPQIARGQDILVRQEAYCLLYGFWWIAIKGLCLGCTSSNPAESDYGFEWPKFQMCLFIALLILFYGNDNDYNGYNDDDSIFI